MLFFFFSGHQLQNEPSNLDSLDSELTQPMTGIIAGVYPKWARVTIDSYFGTLAAAKSERVPDSRHPLRHQPKMNQER